MENTKNKIGMAFLIILLLTFVIGGYFFMNYMVNIGEDERVAKKEEDLRIDDSKDYIYLDNGKEVTHEIVYEDLVLNIKGLEAINNTLHEELKNMENSITSLPEGIVCEDDVYTANTREYQITTYSNYLSVVIYDYNYNCSSGSTPVNIKSFVIDKNTGNIYKESDLLQNFNISEEQINESVNKRLTDTQTLDENEQVIDINGTIEALKNSQYNTSKALSVSKNGKLVINFIVKSNKINYNDSIEI